MLKGLKLKTKLPDKDSNNTSSSAAAQQSHRVEEPAAPSTQGKRWLKVDSQPQRPSAEDKVTEEDLVQTCRDIWQSFLGGQMDDTETLLKDLKRKERKFYDNKKEETFIVNKHILEDKEEDIFESIEKTALKNFDPKKTAYIISDIMADNVKYKGKSVNDAVYKMYKKGPKYDSEKIYDEEYDTKEVEEENKKKSKKDKKLEKKEKQRETMQANRVQRILANCNFCLNNNHIMEEQILSFSSNALLLLPDIKKYKKDHFYIIPIEHASSQIEIDDDQYEEIKNYMKCLVAMYDKRDYGVIFMETYIDVEKSPHCIIEAIAMPRAIHEEIPLYFKKALSELESEWATHKKIIEIKKEKGGIRKQIPKNFPYFYIDFDTTRGYAHVIEKTKDFKRNFAHEILGSLLDVEKTMTMFPKKLERKELADMKEKFQSQWDEFDWTKML